MSKHETPEVKLPPWWITVPLSALVLWHFFAIFTAVTGTSSPGHPAPELCVRGQMLATPYLRALYLENAYRFFAPDPGPSQLLWFRIRYQDGTIRWIEFPRKEDSWFRMPYQRGLCLGMQTGNSLALDPQGSPQPRRDAFFVVPMGQGNASFRWVSQGQPQPSPGTLAVTSSCARHVAHTYGRTNPDGTPNPVEEVQLYLVNHRFLTPEEVQSGVKPTDLPAYTPIYLGCYRGDGTLKTPREYLGLWWYHSLLATNDAWKISDVVVLLLEDIHQQGVDPEDRELPTPVRLLLKNHPDLIRPSRPHEILADRLAEALSKPVKNP